MTDTEMLERLEAAGKILAKGGVLYVSSDIMAALERAAESVTATPLGIRIVASKYMPPNTWAAVAPTPDLYVQRRAWYVEPSPV
jgi:tRNA G46 methylase TrmB